MIFLHTQAFCCNNVLSLGWKLILIQTQSGRLGATSAPLMLLETGSNGFIFSNYFVDFKNKIIGENFQMFLLSVAFFYVVFSCMNAFGKYLTKSCNDVYSSMLHQINVSTLLPLPCYLQRRCHHKQYQSHRFRTFHMFHTPCCYASFPMFHILIKKTKLL